MEIIFLILGIIIGISFMFFIQKIKNNNLIDKNLFDNEVIKNQEYITQLKILQNDSINLNKKIQEISQKIQEKESQNIEFQKNISVLETSKTNLEIKIQEISHNFQFELNKNNQLIEENNQLSKKIIETNLNWNNLNNQYKTNLEIIENQALEIKNLIEQNKNYSTKIAQFQVINQSLTENLNKQKDEVENLHKTAQLEFEKIANKILDEKSEKFSTTNKINIEGILKPLGENIESFKKKVEETYEKESKERFSLSNEVTKLIEQTNKISSEANNLASALKGQTKKQGNWGEVILERILENSGLFKNIHYTAQETITNEDGKQFRPDILVKLPENRIIIIDSKVSLISYERFSSTDNIDQQKTHLQAHLTSIYSHIDDLSNKNYDDLKDSLDFVIMFIPIEPSYLIAIQADEELWNYAYNKRILLISPTNLIACLKLISDLWKRELQSKNAKEIVRRGELMYDKFVLFSKSLEELGRNIERTQKSYQDSIKQLNQGSGNLVNQAIQLKNLGLKSNKEIPQNLISFEENI